MKRKDALIIWGKVEDILVGVRNNNLSGFLIDLIGLVKVYKIDFVKILDNTYKDKDHILYMNNMAFIEFVTFIIPENFIIGSSGDNFEIISKNYIHSTPKLEIEIWSRVSHLIKDLITFNSEKVCTQCQSDHLRILTDLENGDLFEYCETCFFIKPEINKTSGERLLVPACKESLKKGGYLDKVN